MALNGNAIISVDDAKTYLSIESSITEFDTEIEGLVNELSALFANYCGRDSFANSSYIEYPDGKDDDTTWLRNYPVDDVTSSVLIYLDDGRVYGNDSLVDSDDFTVELSTGRVILDGAVFSSWPKSTKVTYYGGAVAEVKLAAKEYVQWAWKRKNNNTVGVNSTSPQQGGSVTLETDMPASVKTILDRYKRW